MREREPPHDFGAEQAVLGSVLVNNGALDGVAEIVRPEHFADPLHGRLFAALELEIATGRSINAIGLSAAFANDADLAAAGGKPYIAKLVARSTHAHDAIGVARLVKDQWMRRQIIKTAEGAIERAYGYEFNDDAQRQVESIEGRLLELGGGPSTDGFKSAAELAQEAACIAERAYSRSAGTNGLGTGLPSLDALVGGLQKSDLLILAGRPSMGKTALATGIAVAAATRATADANTPPPVVGLFSLEMSGTQLVSRMIAERAGVSSSRMSRGELSSTEFDGVLNAAFTFDARLHVDDTAALSVAALRARARRLKRLHGLDLLVVDYLQLLAPADSGRRTNRVEDVSEITRGLKTLAKELDVPVLALSQLSRAVEQRDDKRPQLADLRESGSIEQDADVVMFIYREEYYLARTEPMRRQGESDDAFTGRHGSWDKAMMQSRGRAEVIVAKHRHGPTGTVRLNFDGALTRFTDPASADEAASW
ncbi:replicative DNA helicase [Rhodospirillales bacterium URHD0017]|nr:replicative DNA helicase [Rhodospirillales bacterium URHD0017]